MEKKQFNILRYTLTKDQIGTFISGLHDIQEDMIEAVVASKAALGYPEANVIIKHIMEIK